MYQVLYKIIVDSSTDLVTDRANWFGSVHLGCLGCLLQMYRWLGYANMPASLPDAEGKIQSPEEQSDFFLKREFSFTIEDDVYIRYDNVVGMTVQYVHRAANVNIGVRIAALSTSTGAVALAAAVRQVHSVCEFVGHRIPVLYAGFCCSTWPYSACG